MTQRSLIGPTIAIFLVLVFVRLLAAALVPIVQDEAYYLEWSKALDWGYFDHPPLVGILIQITTWGTTLDHEFFVRLSGLFFTSPRPGSSIGSRPRR